nr:(+)-sabinene synthase, chloroplastic-like [Lolium perenne]
MSMMWVASVHTAASMWPSSTPPARRCAPQQLRCSLPEPKRRSADYQPSSWDYDAIMRLKDGGNHTNQNHDQVVSSSFDNLMKSMMMSKHDQSSCKLKFIDMVQRLGIAYHFEQEIYDILSSIHKNPHHAKKDLSFAALRFRLLREKVFSVSPGSQLNENNKNI